MKKPFTKWLLMGVAGSCVIVFISVGFFKVNRQNRRMLNYQFNGRVDNVTYSDLGDEHKTVMVPTVTIKGKSFFAISFMGFWLQNTKRGFYGKKQQHSCNNTYKTKWEKTCVWI